MPDDQIGEYRLLQKLGEGAAGEVYLGTPTRQQPFASPGDPLAIKVYRPEILRQAAQVERIEREFKVGSTLSHPNLVRMLDYKIEATTKPYLVMEYVDGIALDAWVDMFHPTSARLLVRIVDQLIGGLSYLHENEIIHRDLKPQNIMLSSTFEPKIMDFGVVRITTATPITPKDKFVGTIRNAAPEFLFGHDYDERADLYSLGTVLYMLLFGEQVFADEDQFARLIERVQTSAPYFDESIASRDSAIAVLAEMTRSLLEKNADRRPRSIADLKDRLLTAKTAVPPADATLSPLHGYIATALTGLETEARDAIVFTSSRVADVAKDYDLYVYQPRKATDPLLHPDVDPAAVYLLDRKRVLRADVLLVLANQPSFGVGQELEIASSYGKPTILLAREGTRISRMVTGSFLNLLDEIIYRTPEDLSQKLRRSLIRNLEAVRQHKRAAVVTRSRTEIGSKLAAARAARGYVTSEAFARAIGAAPRLVAAVENGDLENLGLSMLARLSNSLGLSLRDLFIDTPDAPQVPQHDQNLTRLETLAAKLGWSARDYFDLREDYQRQVAASGEPARLADDQWAARKNAIEQRRLRSVDAEPTQRPLF